MRNFCKFCVVKVFHRIIISKYCYRYENVWWKIISFGIKKNLFCDIVTFNTRFAQLNFVSSYFYIIFTIHSFVSFFVVCDVRDVMGIFICVEYSDNFLLFDQNRLNVICNVYEQVCEVSFVKSVYQRHVYLPLTMQVQLY